jgi:hypothetical protein
MNQINILRVAPLKSISYHCKLHRLKVAYIPFMQIGELGMILLYQKPKRKRRKNHKLIVKQERNRFMKKNNKRNNSTKWKCSICKSFVLCVTYLALGIVRS